MTIDIVAAIVGLAVVVALVVAARLPPRLSVRVQDQDLRIRFTGWDAVWTLRREVVVPVGHVVGVEVVPLSQVPREGWRRRGTWIPGVIRAGSFGRSDRRDLWDVRVPEHVLVLRLRPGAPYRRIILQVRDPNAAAHDLRRALRASARPTPPHQR